MLGTEEPESEVVKIAQDLIRLESHSGPEFEQGVARYIASYLGSRGIETEVQEAYQGRPNLVATLEGVSAGPRLLLTGHMDTVPARDWEGPGGAFQPERTDDRLYGRGACDMKGALAAMIVALCRAKSMSLRGTVVFAAVAGEEGSGSIGTVELVRTGPSFDYAIVGEPTKLDVCVSHKGSYNMLLSVAGRAAHSATPQQGINAVDGLVRALEQVSTEVKPWVESHQDSLLGRSTLSVTGVEGGGRSDTIPASATALLNLRYVPALTPAEVESRLDTRLHRLTDEGFEIRVGRRHVQRVSAGGTYELDAIPLITDPMSPLVVHASEAVHAATGRPARPVGLACWTDAALLNPKVATTIVLGPGDISFAHGPQEYVSIHELEEAVSIYLGIIGRICSEG